MQSQIIDSPVSDDFLSLQQLRSTFGSLYLQQGVSLSKIGLWLGHSIENATRRHYAALMAYDDDIEKLKM